MLSTFTGIEYIKVPTWLFHGGNDTVVPINISLQIMHRYMGCFLYTKHSPTHILSHTVTIISLSLTLTAPLPPQPPFSGSHQKFIKLGVVSFHMPRLALYFLIVDCTKLFVFKAVGASAVDSNTYTCVDFFHCHTIRVVNGTPNSSILYARGVHTHQ